VRFGTLQGGQEGEKIMPISISDQQEKRAIETALSDTQSKALLGCHEHLAKALDLLSRDDNPASIKESILAVESICRIITKTHDTLGESVKKLPFELHPAFTKAISSLFGLMGDAPPVAVDAADAKFFLVTASSFVHYLVRKANAQGMAS
jgi:hypothetical protein